MHAPRSDEAKVEQIDPYFVDFADVDESRLGPVPGARIQDHLKGRTVLREVYTAPATSRVLTIQNSTSEKDGPSSSASGPHWEESIYKRP